ncbi:MAG: hypothetical protein QOJ29_3825 [Thermoleophilaceae bacterium]|nr:hypothetical protein [Thermoleophilaceae bacterium]
MADPPTYLDVDGHTVRERLVNALRLDLLGPETPDEVLNQSPNTRYLVGMLAPSGTPLDPVEDETFEASESDEPTDGQAPMAASLDPSSIGISFAIEVGARPVRVDMRWGEYEKVETHEELDAEESPAVERNDATADGAGKQTRRSVDWPRTQHEASHELPVAATVGLQRIELAPGLELQWLGREIQGAVVFSVFLVNTREAPVDGRPPDEHWIYQPEIHICPTSPVIVARDMAPGDVDPDPDIASADLTYRKRRELATGHGVSADWELSDGAVDRARRAWTTVIPETIVPIVSPAGGGVPPLEMDDLAAADADQLVALLTPVADAYGSWIAERQKELATIPEPARQVGRDHLALAGDALERMRTGVQLLRADETARKAFNFANEAMALQLRKSIAVRARRRGLPDPEGVEARWRPFQMGFILQCLASLADPTHDDREIADLLWFPTGGGKTEAYLGLTAFTLANRRLRPDVGGLENGAGTSVLMRYTLRLLTIQQFQRALALLCACEHLRQADTATWGGERFTIGLWVGQSATPNSYSDSKHAVQELREGKRVYKSSPYQVLYCPWCGEDLTPEQYTCSDDLERTLVHCASGDCEFGPGDSALGLPVLMVDEEIYRNPPSVLLATVDKFAQMPLNGKIQSLFGRVNRHCSRHGYLSGAEKHPAKHSETKASKAATVAPCGRLAPPDLVIQDELHLISGPLGTLVGLYEVVVQGLCIREIDGRTIRPKVVSSTATIRRAASQVEGLFGLQVAIFPPLGLEADQSFFAKPADPKEAPGRAYVGLYAPGKSVKTALVRVYGALLSRALVEFEADPAPESDAYMTLVGYFNSLRELGGAVRLVEDDVPARLRVLRRRGFGPQRPIFENQELTSRIPSSQIPARLQQLERTFVDRQAGAYPIDVLLASNMLSVGVDIDRLGLMVVSGQPKTSAEYIQATSRVGRQYPGLVIAVFNWIRPRDTSHYERFRHYHDTFYRHVEATSVTPFSARARDRALPAVLAAYVRLADEASSPEAAARNFRRDNPAAGHILDVLTARAFEATNRDDVRVETEMQLRNLIDSWDEWAAEDEPELVYTRRGMGNTKTTPSRMNLLRSMEQRGAKGHWPAAGSLREVEPEVDVVLRPDGMG